MNNSRLDDSGQEKAVMGTDQHFEEFAMQEPQKKTADGIALVPIPSNSPHDPFNWPAWRKNLLLVQVSFHAMMSTFSAAAIIPAFSGLAAEFNVSINRASYLTTTTIICIGVSPFFWIPISNRYGRRPILLISTLVSSACCVGCAYAKTYATLVVARAFQGFFISTAVAIGAQTVTEMFFQHERGKKMGVWTLLTTLGPNVAPFIMGFVVQHKGIPWIFYILAMINLAQFILYLFFGPETLFLRTESVNGSIPEALTEVSSSSDQFFKFRRINPAPIKLWDFISPLSMFKYLDVLLPTIAYSVVFVYTGVVLTVLVPQLEGEKFRLTDQGVGLQFVSLIIGAVIGEQIGGPFSDFVMNRRTAKAGRRIPENRLIASWPGFVFGAVGIIIWGVELDKATEGHWNVKPAIGGAISVFGLQIVTTVCVTYAVDCHRDRAGQVSVFITFIRQMWAFLGPFYFTTLFENLGDSGGVGVLAGCILAMLIPIFVIDIIGRRKRV